MSTKTQGKGGRLRPKSPREIALGILHQVDTRRAFADLQLNRALRDHALEPRDAAFVTELVNGTLRWRARLDWTLSRYLRNDLGDLPPWIRNGLRLALYQLLCLDRVPPHAAVDEAVKMARVYGHPGTAGLTNGVLRKILRDPGGPPDPERVIPDRAEALAVACSHPRWMVDRWRRVLGDEEARALMMANNRPAGMSLRIHPGRTDRESLRRVLGEHGIETEPGALSRVSLRVKGNFVPDRDPEFASFFVQDESETLVGELLDPQAGETILDLCAAPGGKTCHIQESRGSRGFVIAADIQRPRLVRVVENVARLGLENVFPVQADGLTLALSRPVDRVLVDAPCSGLGVLGRRADARWRKTEASLRGLLALERDLLAAGSAWVRPGGVLVYSVCSFEPEEGPVQVRWFLEAHPRFELEDASRFLPPEAVTNGCLLLYPHRHGTDGAFGARFRRRS
jgi:16S rRNA (cytosine967-C5)-methyltransferase